MSNDKQNYMHLLMLLSNAVAFVLMCSTHISCCYDSSYVGYPEIFVSAPKESLKILNCFKNIWEKKNVCIYCIKWFSICENGGVVLYTQSLNYKGFRFYSHFKISPMLSYLCCLHWWSYFDVVNQILAMLVLPLLLAKSFLKQDIAIPLNILFSLKWIYPRKA